MPDRKTVVGLGEVLWDVFGREKRLGGAPANFAYHANQLGDRGVPVSRVGADQDGRDILAALAAAGMTTEYVQVDRLLPTGTVQVTVDSAGQPAFTIAHGVAWENLRITTALRSLMREADAVCYGTLAQRGSESRRTIRLCLSAVPKTSLRVCDLNLRGEMLRPGPLDSGQVELIRDSILAADVLKLNGAELEAVGSAFARSERGEDLLTWAAREFKPRMLCVTMGEQGCVLRTLRRRVPSPGIRVKVVDTVGSGDAFTAGLVHGLLRGWPLDEIAGFANRLGAFVASKPGAMPPLDGFQK